MDNYNELNIDELNHILEQLDKERIELKRKSKEVIEIRNAKIFKEDITNKLKRLSPEEIQHLTEAIENYNHSDVSYEDKTVIANVATIDNLAIKG